MTSSPHSPIRRSIEVEYWVIDDDGRLTDPERLVQAGPGVEREFVAPMIEIKTSPCETMDELRNELLGRIRTVLHCADEENKGLVPLATSLNRDTIRELPSDRTRIQNRVFGSAFQYVRHCAGTHIHFEQQPGHAIDQLNTLIALDPALALLNSARHFRGQPLVAGARSELYRRRAYDGCPLQGTLWSYVSDRDEWEQRLSDCYDDFRARALRNGADRDTVDSCFDADLPECAAWIPIKLRDTFGTVEWRSPDTTLPSEVLRLAETMTSLMDRVRRTPVRQGNGRGDFNDGEMILPSFDTVATHVDLAIRDGLDSDRVCSYLDRVGFDVDAYTPFVNTFDCAPIPKSAARRVRLESAEQLRADVEARAPAAFE
ncbi:MAG: glutamate--cysteine ligase [Bacteroidetes bacterium SW_9_63_38]|nr:MAG: glutamate--cysteine ligase [Bacteroidetes bacterium SW_9_63_38]